MTNARYVSIPLIILAVFFICSCSQPEPQRDLESFRNDQTALYYFDYHNIGLESTTSIGIDISKLNLDMDMYGTLALMGEIKNNSSSIKSDLVFTLDFLDNRQQPLFSLEYPSRIKYLLPKSTMPFCLYIDQKDKYIDISRVKIGTNYKDLHSQFKGNPVVQQEKYYYEGNYLIIEGQLINLGSVKVEDLLLFCTFYNSKQQVVSVKKCYLPRRELNPQSRQKFELKLLMDAYLPDFTHHDFAVFFKDALEEVY